VKRQRRRYMRLYQRARRERLTGKPYAGPRKSPPEKPCPELRVVNKREYYRRYMIWWRWHGNVKSEAEKWAS
jgi:hypothetical protein